MLPRQQIRTTPLHVRRHWSCFRFIIADYSSAYIPRHHLNSLLTMSDRLKIDYHSIVRYVLRAVARLLFRLWFPVTGTPPINARPRHRIILVLITPKSGATLPHSQLDKFLGLLASTSVSSQFFVMPHRRQQSPTSNASGEGSRRRRHVSSRLQSKDWNPSWCVHCGVDAKTLSNFARPAKGYPTMASRHRLSHLQVHSWIHIHRAHAPALPSISFHSRGPMWRVTLCFVSFNQQPLLENTFFGDRQDGHGTIFMHAATKSSDFIVGGL